MKNLFVFLLLTIVFTSCKKSEPAPVVEATSPLVGKWLKSRQIGQVTTGGKTVNIVKNIGSQGAYYDFRADGSYTESFFDSTASTQPNKLTTGKYALKDDQIRLVVDNTNEADIKYLEYVLNNGNNQMYLTDSKNLRLKAIDEQSKLNTQLAQLNSDKLKGIDDFEVAYRLEKQ